MALLVPSSLHINVRTNSPSAGLFTFFSLGMSLSSLQFVFLNTTSVENLSRQTKIWTLAVYMHGSPATPHCKPYRTITYPLIRPPLGTPFAPSRTFAILHSKPGENPYNLGLYGNFTSVMGNNIFDWLVPLRYSPCCDHESSESAFALGPVVQRMREEAGLHSVQDVGRNYQPHGRDTLPAQDGRKRHRRHRRRGKPRRHETSNHAQPGPARSSSHHRPLGSVPVEQMAKEGSDAVGNEGEHGENIVG